MKINLSTERWNEWMTVIFFGVLSAIAGNLHFNIPGIMVGITDPRELVALSSVFFLKDWKSALVVGIMAAFGGPYNNTIYNTLLMHALAIPAAWFLFHMGKNRIKRQSNLVILWTFQVIGIYLFIFIPLLTLSMWVLGKMHLGQFWATYAIAFEGLKLEMVLTAIITALILALRLTRMELTKEGYMLNLFIQSEEFGVWEWDVKNDKLQLSRHWKKKIGIQDDIDGITMQRYLEAIHPEDRAVFKNKIDQMVQGKIRISHSEYRFMREEKLCCWVFNSAQRLDSVFLGMHCGNIIGIIMDISERKQAEAEYEQLRQQLIQSQKMESIGTLAGGIAHDFNNLLTVINGHAEIAALRLDKPDIVKKDLQAIQSAGSKAVQLTSQLLAFSRKQIYEPRNVNLNKVVGDMQKMLMRLIGEDIHIEMILTDPLPKIMADPVQIEQILLNLVVNARDAINEATDKASEKKITIETGKADLKSTYQDLEHGRDAGEYVLFSVSDNGIGMDKDITKRIFDPFFTTKGKSRGTGLGLSMVYGIIKQNRGHISVYSEPGIGTTFKIYWPASDAEDISGDERPVAITQISGNETILYVEDDSLVREFAVNVLSNFGYRVHHTGSGKKALEWVAENKVKPDLLITDLIMPEMNGRELAEKIKEIIPGCPVLYNSGYTDNHIVHNGSLDKGINFLHKPFSPRELLEKIRNILDK